MHPSRKKGRPSGTVESPENLSHKGLIKGLKLYLRIVGDIEKDYDTKLNTMTTTERIEVAEFLRRSNLDFIRLWMAPAKEGSKEPEEMDAAKILKEITGSI